MTSKRVSDDDYTLDEGAGWFEVKGFAIRIHTTDDGVAVDIFDDKALEAGMGLGEPLASVLAFDADCLGDQP